MSFRFLQQPLWPAPTPTHLVVSLMVVQFFFFLWWVSSWVVLGVCLPSCYRVVCFTQILPCGRRSS